MRDVELYRHLLGLEEPWTVYPGAEPSVDQSRCGLEGPDLPSRGVYVSSAYRADSEHPHG